ncbi:hypothetical protein G3C22_004595 [Salmonella enterica]|nr:hypothetical protein [Salmonella enterica]
MFAGKKSAQIREILISESAWEEMTCLFAPSLAIFPKRSRTLKKYHGEPDQETTHENQTSPAYCICRFQRRSFR